MRLRLRLAETRESELERRQGEGSAFRMDERFHGDGRETEGEAEQASREAAIV